MPNDEMELKEPALAVTVTKLRAIDWMIWDEMDRLIASHIYDGAYHATADDLAEMRLLVKASGVVRDAVRGIREIYGGTVEGMVDAVFELRELVPYLVGNEEMFDEWL